jgi:DNA-directed RNA polymerase specialized sigma24 family protein
MLSTAYALGDTTSYEEDQRQYDLLRQARDLAEHQTRSALERLFLEQATIYIFEAGRVEYILDLAEQERSPLGDAIAADILTHKAFFEEREWSIIQLALQKASRAREDMPDNAYALLVNLWAHTVAIPLCELESEKEQLKVEARLLCDQLGSAREFPSAALCMAMFFSIDDDIEALKELAYDLRGRDQGTRAWIATALYARGFHEDAQTLVASEEHSSNVAFAIARAWIAGAIERWHPHDESTRFRHWLRRVAGNAISNALTRRPRDIAAGGTAIQDVLERQDERDCDLSREIELEHRREIFLRAASIVKTEVSADTWQVFQLTVIEGCAIEKAASRMSKSVGAAYAARGRVMNRLRRIVNEMERRES